MGSHVFKIDTREPEKLLEAVTASLGADSRIARQVAEQMPKPAITEPQEFGSIVRAGFPSYQPSGGERLLWQKCPEKGKHYWESETGAVEVWSELTDVEVLRIGVGDEKVEAPTRREQIGAATMKGKVLAALRLKRAEALTAERQNAFDKAIKLVEELVS